MKISKDYHKKWRKENPNYQKDWFKKHPNYGMEYNRKRKASDPFYVIYLKERGKNYYLKYGKIIQKRRVYIGAHRALSAVRRAIKTNRLLSLKKEYILCVDCKKNRAIQYDHRDYNKPLDVTPVCRSCNKKRGSAIPIKRVGSALMMEV